MSIKKFSKRIMTVNPPSWKKEIEKNEEVEEALNELASTISEHSKNKKKKEESNMTTMEKMDRAAALAQNVNAPKEVKRVKADRGLIERTESSKIVLTEDNRQVLND